MKLRDIDCGKVFNAAGSRNFSGQGYWYHRWLKYAGLNFDHATFTAKTVTIEKRVGNMPLGPDGETPMERFPRCIWVNIPKALALNCVGLSNFGLRFYLEQGYWQKYKKPMCISFMATGNTPDNRLAEDTEFVDTMREYKTSFRTSFVVQRNYSCPNTGHDPRELIDEIMASLDVLQELGVPIIVKSNLEMPVLAAKKITNHPACDALCMSNTIPFGRLPDIIPWKNLFPDGISPLIKRGFDQPGGLSGSPLFLPVCDWIRGARKEGIMVPIIVCGGILSVQCVDEAFKAGGNAIDVGSVAFLRPYRVKKISRRANKMVV